MLTLTNHFVKASMLFYGSFCFVFLFVFQYVCLSFSCCIFACHEVLYISLYFSLFSPPRLYEGTYWGKKILTPCKYMYYQMLIHVVPVIIYRDYRHQGLNSIQLIISNRYQYQILVRNCQHNSLLLVMFERY